MNEMVRLAEHFGFQALIGLLMNLRFWLKGLVAVAVVGSIFWLFSNRGSGKRSLGALLRYLFPREYYTHPTMKPAYWNVLWWILIFSPFAASIGGAKLGESFAVWLAGRFGSGPPLFTSAWATAALQLSVVFWGTSLFSYSLHYAFHKVPLLWSIHRVHHSSEALGITALLHTHPLEDLAMGPLLALPIAFVNGLTLYAMGAREFSPAVLAIIGLYGTWDVLHGIFEHSHVPVSLGWFNRIYAGAVLHQIHHSVELRHRDKNLGQRFAVIWDWIFGTIYIPDRNEQYRWGLNDDEYGENNPHLTLRDFYLEPLAYARSTISAWRLRDQPASPEDSPLLLR